MLVAMKSKQRSREFWEEAVERAKTSGRTRAQSAKELGVGGAALSYWIGKLRKERGAGATKARSRSLVPVRVVDAETARGAGLSLEVAGMVLHFEQEAGVEYIARLVGALRQC